MVEAQPSLQVTSALKSNHGLECFQGLKGSLEADRAWLDVVPGSGLRDDRTDEIVGEEMCPDFLSNKFRRLASQDIHLQRDLD